MWGVAAFLLNYVLSLLGMALGRGRDAFSRAYPGDRQDILCDRGRQPHPTWGIPGRLTRIESFSFFVALTPRGAGQTAGEPITNGQVARSARY